MARSKIKQSFYDNLAPHYRNYSDKKANYLKTIDKLIIEHGPKKAISLLDVGAGDGLRATKLAQNLKIKKVSLVEPSKEMVKLCKKLKVHAVHQAYAQTMPTFKDKFDIVLCLWNVLGHISNHKNRVKALRKMKENLSDNGIIFLDVNNRYNASSYGWVNILSKIIIDTILPDEKRGDVSYSWLIDDKKIPGMGHLFTPSELTGLIKESGLKVTKKYFVNYISGEMGKTFFQGQMFFIIQK